MVQPARVLLVHLGSVLGEGVRFHLERAGFTVSAAEALAEVSKLEADLVVFGWRPGETGEDVAGAKARGVPVLALVDAPPTPVEALSEAALASDDFVLYPFEPSELTVRARTLLGREAAARPGPEAAVEIGEVRLDRPSKRAWLAGAELPLTRREADLLVLLMSNPEVVFSRKALLHHAWGQDFSGKLRTVDQHITQLRAHLLDEPNSPRYIRTVRGQGYVFLQPRG